jgi:hypothetical protein
MPPPQTQPLSTHHLRSENSSPELRILRPIHNLRASPSHESSSGLSTSNTHVHKRHPSPLSDEDGQRKSIQSESKDTYTHYGTFGSAVCCSYCHRRRCDQRSKSSTFRPARFVRNQLLECFCVVMFLMHIFGHVSLTIFIGCEPKLIKAISDFKHHLTFELNELRVCVPCAHGVCPGKTLRMISRCDVCEHEVCEVCMNGGSVETGAVCCHCESDGKAGIGSENHERNGYQITRDEVPPSIEIHEESEIPR